MNFKAIVVPSFAFIRRGITTTCVRNGKRNFKKFHLYGKRGTRMHKEQQARSSNPELPVDHRGTRPIGIQSGDQFVTIPEMIPELIVPNLEGFKLKPYVSYKTQEIKVGEFTAKHLFNEIYASKINEDFKKGELTPKGEPLNPSENEKLTSEEAERRAGKTGTDLFATRLKTDPW